MSRLVEIYGSDEMRRFGESDFPLLIGSNKEAHIHLPGIASTAAHVGESRGHLFLQSATALDADAVYHNDEHVEGSVWLKSADVTRIGDWVICWHYSGDRLEAHVSKGQRSVIPPPAKRTASLNAAPIPRILPRVAPDKKQRNRSGFRSFFAVLFVLLLFCASIILLAKPVEVVINPEPDRLVVSGFPPPLRFADRFVGLPGSYTIQAEKVGYYSLKQQVDIGGTSVGRYQFTLQKLPGRLTVTSSPVGVTVSVNGAPAGLTPVTDLELVSGGHVLQFDHPRYFSLQKNVEIEGGGKRQNMAIRLEPAWAMMTIISEPAGADIFVDGQQKGRTPIALELVQGSHALLLQKEKFRNFDTEIAVQAGIDRILPTYTLIPSPATLVLRSNPTGVAISVDSLFKGKTPITLSLTSGESHQIDMVAAGFLPQRKNVVLQAAEQRQLTITLQEEFGTIFLSTTPADAMLYVNDKKFGPATGKLSLPSRPHKIEVRAKGYISSVQTVTPQAGFSQRIEINLTRPQAVVSHTPPAAVPDKLLTAAGQQMILVTPTLFTMGASRRDAGRRANEREHQVQLRRSFYISTKEVTNAEFRLFQPYHSSAGVSNRSLDSDLLPVVNVSWHDAARFCNWLSKKDNLAPFYLEENGKMVRAAGKSNGYRLPTEAEWAYVARIAGKQKRAQYPWQGSFPPPSNVGNFADESARHLLPLIIEGYTDSYPATAPTGSFAANAIGLYDIGGNVAEWCHDYYEASVGIRKEIKVDPMGPESGSHHLVRGASWRDAGITELRLSYRRYSRKPSDDIGFRIARYEQ